MTRQYGTTLDLERSPGRCAFCDAPLTAPQAKVSCGKSECKAAYQSVYFVKYSKQRAERRKATGLRSDGYPYGSPSVRVRRRIKAAP